MLKKQANDNGFNWFRFEIYRKTGHFHSIWKSIFWREKRSSRFRSMTMTSRTCRVLNKISTFYFLVKLFIIITDLLKYSVHRNTETPTPRVGHQSNTCVRLSNTLAQIFWMIKISHQIHLIFAIYKLKRGAGVKERRGGWRYLVNLLKNCHFMNFKQVPCLL